MTEIFVSGTEVFSDAKMTETPYELRRVDMYVGAYIVYTIVACAFKMKSFAARFALTAETQASSAKLHSI